MPATSSASQKSSVTGDGGLSVSRRYTEAGTHPFDMVEWEIRDAIIGNPEKPAFDSAVSSSRRAGRRTRPTSSRRSTSAAR